MNLLRFMHRQRPALDLPSWLNLLIGVVIVGYVVFSALITMPYANTQRALVCAYAVVGLGLHLLMGRTGQLSMGHGFFFAIGAYTCAILVGSHGWPYLATLPVAAVIGWILGFLFGLPALRLSELALGLVTLALALVTPALINRFSGITGGTVGLVLPAPKPPAGLATDQWVLYLCLAVTVIVYAICWLVGRGRTGRAMVGIRDNQTVVTTLGVRPSTMKAYVFALSAAFAAIGGVLYATTIQFVGADAFNLNLAIAFLTIVVIGGLGSAPGVILGAIFVVYMPNWTNDLSQAVPGLMYGLALVVFMFVLPFGLIGLVRMVLQPVVNAIRGGIGSRRIRSRKDEQLAS